MSNHESLEDRARTLAERAHQSQTRKGNGAPYFTHLESVVGWLEAHGYTDAVTVSAGYLHDVLEDQPAFADELRTTMPPEVVRTVELLSETKHDAQGNKISKHQRVKQYMQRLQETLRSPDEAERNAAMRAVVVSCCDKLDNARSLLEGERRGEGLLARLNTRPGDHTVHLGMLRAVYQPVVHASLLNAFDHGVRALSEHVDAWLVAHAVAIAANAHRGQRDKAGAPYVLHPLRLLLRAKTPHEQMTAVLHDVVEDTSWTLEQLHAEGFPERVLEALECLTLRNGESYDDFIARITHNALATRIKLFDIEDNMDLRRFDAVSEKDLARVGKYVRARKALVSRLEQIDAQPAARRE